MHNEPIQCVVSFRKQIKRTKKTLSYLKCKLKENTMRPQPKLFARSKYACFYFSKSGHTGNFSRGIARKIVEYRNLYFLDYAKNYKFVLNILVLSQILAPQKLQSRHKIKFVIVTYRVTIALQTQIFTPLLSLSNTDNHPSYNNYCMQQIRRACVFIPSNVKVN